MRKLLSLHAGKERFGDRIVQWRTWIGKRLIAPQLSEPLPELELCILASLVTVKRQSSWSFPTFKGLLECVLHHLRSDFRYSSMRKNLSGKQINNNTHIAKLVLYTNISYVAHPDNIGFRLLKLLFDLFL